MVLMGRGKGKTSGLVTEAGKLLVVGYQVFRLEEAADDARNGPGGCWLLDPEGIKCY